MSQSATSPSTGVGGPPWTAQGTVYFYGGPLSNFAPTQGLRLPFGYHGHHENDRVPVRTVEHWFQACKATSRQRFDVILASGTAAAAKRAGRATELRSDWELVKLDVMLCALRGKFAVEPYRSALLLTHARPLAEDSPVDFVWGCRDAQGGHGGQNLLGLALMQVRAELIADVRTRLAGARIPQLTQGSAPRAASPFPTFREETYAQSCRRRRAGGDHDRVRAAAVGSRLVDVRDGRRA